ncbi:MAG: TIGR04255 family protein [Candidatus Muiribacteriota bacterium]
MKKNIFEILQNDNLEEDFDSSTVREAVVEIKFDPVESTPYQAIYGMVYNEFRYDYPLNEELPVAKIPPQVREKDPKIKYRPHHVMQNDKFRIRLGPRVLIVGINYKYSNRDEFLTEVNNIFKKVHKLNFIKNVTRVGLRTINFLPEEEFDKFNISFLVNKQPFEKDDLYVRTIYSHPIENVKVNMQILKKAKLQQYSNDFGSIIDLDCFSEGNSPFITEDIKADLFKLHEHIRTLYYGLKG